MKGAASGPGSEIPPSEAPFKGLEGSGGEGRGERTREGRRELHLRKASRGLHLRKASRGLQGGFKGASRGLEGGLKGVFPVFTLLGNPLHMDLRNAYMYSFSHHFTVWLNNTNVCP